MHEKKMDKYLGEKTHRAEKIASIRGKKPHVYRVIILKQMADHTISVDTDKSRLGGGWAEVVYRILGFLKGSKTITFL